MARRRRWLVTVAAIGAGALALPAGASAGGFATVGLSSLPDGTAAGRPWDVKLTILQHGREPLTWVRPEIIVTGAGGETTRRFAARPTGEDGVYAARVVFPAAGTWSYVVDDGFSMTHTFAPVTIAAATGQSAAAPARTAAPAPDGGPDLAAAFFAALAAGLLVAGLTVLLVRRRGTAGPPAAARP